MGKVVILTEKPSAAKNFAAALGGKSGTYNGESYQIVNALGHLLEFKQPVDMVSESLVPKYKSWEVSQLPWNPDDFSWEREPRKKNGKVDSGVASLLRELKSEFASATEIVLASDIDPTGEGDLLAWEIVDYLGMHGKKISRMEFLDEAPASLQKAFVARRTVKSMQDEGAYRKAQFRSQWDLLSMQFTRAASKIAGSKAPLRNGRLKSAMVVLVGDQLEAHRKYVKKPFFENRFRDENGVVYTDPEVERFENAADVPSDLHASAVIHDSTTRKKTAPPKLLELSGLSALLSKKGYSAKKVLEVYQQMYESQVVSYPRTEDKFVSEEQFKELLPLVDKIAGVVGIDPNLLSHRTPRKTHVKNGGAHGANRPGPNVPSSLQDVEATYGKLGREIYDTLAKNYLRMLAPDYEYDQHRGHVADYPSFVGTLNVPAVLGWKGVFVLEDDDEDDEETSGAKSLGSRAEPFVHEGYPPRPPHPSMTWLMKQLERRSVGTGATRTSTYAEVTNNATGKALLLEKKGGKLELSDLGRLNHRILPGTHIGSLDLTAKVFDQMKQVESGSAKASDFLAEVAGLVREDIATMQANVKNFSAEFKAEMSKAGVYQQPVETIDLPPNLQFTHNGKTVTKAKRVFSGHRFTDAEVAKLVAGETIEITAKSAKTGNEYTCKGALESGVLTKDGKEYPYVSFKPRFEEREMVEGEYMGRKWVKFSPSFAGHRFTREEIAKLLAGDTIEFEATSKAGNKFTAKGKLGEGTYQGKKTFGFQLDTSGWGKGGGKGGAKRGGRR